MPSFKVGTHSVEMAYCILGHGIGTIEDGGPG